MYFTLIPTTNPNSTRNRINSGTNITLMAPFDVHLAKRVTNPSKARHAEYVLWCWWQIYVVVVSASVLCDVGLT